MTTRAAFPGMAQLTTSGLQTALLANERSIILDVRTAAEFNVSHLSGAVHVNPILPVDAVMHKILALGCYEPGNTLVVAYCSLGYRSSDLLAKIAAFLATDAHANSSILSSDFFNLEGGMFKWANEGGTFVCGEDAQTLKVVHPYNSVFGAMLNPELRYEMPTTQCVNI